MELSYNYKNYYQFMMYSFVHEKKKYKKKNGDPKFVRCSCNTVKSKKRLNF